MTTPSALETASFVTIGEHSSNGKTDGPTCSVSGTRTLVLDRLLDTSGKGTLPSCGRPGCNNHSVPISRITG